MAAKPLSPTDRIKGESTQAFRAFTIYRDLGAGRSLSEVWRRLTVDKGSSGLRIVGNEPATKAQRKPPAGHITLWSTKYHWVERAAQWDALVDQRVRETQLDEIQRMSKRHAQQCQVSLEMLIAPVMAFLTEMRNPGRARELETEDMVELLKASVFASIHIPKLQQSERLSRGVKVIDTEPISNPASAQDPAEWRITVHQPERENKDPTLESSGPQEPEEWEEV